MKVLARHKHAPLVALDDGTVIDTEELEVVGNGDVSGPGWEINPDMEMDPRWEEIARADSSSLGVVETRVKKGSRSFRAPSRVRDDLKTMSIDSPLVEGQGLSLEEMNSLVENDAVTGAAEEWMFGVLNKHDDNADRDHEDVLFSLAEAELDMDEIEAAMDEEEADFNDDDNEIEDYESVPKDAVTAAVTPPPGEFSKIVYIAIIEEDDTKSVQDLVALVQTPAGAASAFSYNGEKGWLDDPEAFQSLQAAAPPPIKQLEDWQTESIISQIASTGELSEEAREQPWEEGTQAGEVHAQPESGPVAASGFELQQAGVLWGPDNQHIMSVVMAAGGWGPNAERLRQYWSTGKGGAKIRWNTPGDWTRCRRYLSKYLGPRAAGYCQLMHKRNTGMFTGDRAHRAMSSLSASTEFATAEDGSTVPDSFYSKTSYPKKGSNTGGNSPEARSKRAYNRHPPGAPNSLGGHFAPGKARNEQAARAQQDTTARKLYDDVMRNPRDRSLRMSEMNDEELQKLTRILYSEKTSDAEIVAARNAVAAEMAKRDYDVKDFGAQGGGIDSDKGANEEPTDESNWDADTESDKPAPAPSTHNGAKIVRGPFEDGSATYDDGYAWDPEEKKFKKI